MLIVGCILAIVVGVTIGAFQSTKPTAAEVARAQARYQRAHDQCMSGAYLGGEQLPPGFISLQDYCDRTVAFQVDTGLKTADLVAAVQGSATFVILIGVILAASLGGADWSSGTMTTLLTWEPRRVRVLLVRALVITLFVFVITFVVQALFVGAFSLAASLRGWTGGNPPGLAEDVVRNMARVSTMAVAIGLVALSIATVGRSTVAALGALFGYLVLFEGVIAGFAPSTQDKLLVRAAGVVVSRQPIYDFREVSTGTIGTMIEPRVLLGLGEAWLVVGFYVVALVGLALLVFRSRDVN
jgi:ABC-type transport system involved in multi-copper enzyme maturation permease subunit